MSENKYCGNCKYFKDEDDDVYGLCEEHIYRCDFPACLSYKPINNGWTEITPDNENELTDELLNRIIIGFKDCEGRMHTMTLLDCYMGVGTMVKYGGYYYYVLPELKIE
jgi:hypothetical protein